MNLFYHLHAGVIDNWSQSSPKISNSKKFVQHILNEHTGLKIDFPNSHGGTSTTGIITRSCFIRHDDHQQDFIYWILKLVDQEFKHAVEIIHRNLAKKLTRQN